MAVKIVLLLAFAVITVAVGVFARKRTANVNQFVLGGRSVGPWMSAFAYGTTYFSAVIFVGYAGQFGWKFGISATWIVSKRAYIGGMIAWMYCTQTRLMTQHLAAPPCPIFFEKRYGSKSLKICRFGDTFIIYDPVTASPTTGCPGFFSMAFNIDYSVCIVAMAVLTAVYVIAGGILPRRSTTYTGHC
jgi:Na+/proline symporter